MYKKRVLKILSFVGSLQASAAAAKDLAVHMNEPWRDVIVDLPLARVHIRVQRVNYVKFASLPLKSVFQRCVKPWMRIFKLIQNVSAPRVDVVLFVVFDLIQLLVVSHKGILRT